MKKIILLIASLVVIMSVDIVRSAAVTTTWSGGTAGSYTWETGANWSSGVYPNNGADKYTVVIGSTTGDRTIETSGNITIDQLGILQNSNSSGISTLKLGGNLTFLNSTTNSYLINQTGNYSNLVINLNGHNFEFSSLGGNIDTANTFTLIGGGNFITKQFYHDSGSSYIGSGVSVKVIGANAIQTVGVIWASNSVFHYSPNDSTLKNLFSDSNPAHAFANVLIGNHTNTTAANLTFANAGSGNGIYINEDITLLSYGGMGGAGKMSIGTGAMNVRGNFIDEGTDSHTYGTGTIYFMGGSDTEHILSTGRSNITTSFQVGRVSEDAGNIALGQDLISSGSFTVRVDSIFNVDNFTLQAANIDLNNGTSTVSNKPTLGFTFGLDSGLIYATNQLSLNYATLNITYDGTGWTDHANLEIFRYGTLNGGVLSNLTLNTVGIGSFGGLQQIGNSIYLTDVVIPEPRSFILLVIGAGLLFIYKRKK